MHINISAGWFVEQVQYLYCMWIGWTDMYRWYTCLLFVDFKMWKRDDSSLNTWSLHVHWRLQPPGSNLFVVSELFIIYIICTNTWQVSNAPLMLTPYSFLHTIYLWSIQHSYAITYTYPIWTGTSPSLTTLSKAAGFYYNRFTWHVSIILLRSYNQGYLIRLILRSPSIHATLSIPIFSLIVMHLGGSHKKWLMHTPHCLELSMWDSSSLMIHQISDLVLWVTVDKLYLKEAILLKDSNILNYNFIRTKIKIMVHGFNVVIRYHKLFSISGLKIWSWKPRQHACSIWET